MSKQPKLFIVVAMSGGVDSSTVAALLASQGHKVVGVTMQLYDSGEFVSRKGACCAGQDIYDAQTAAQKLSIPHYILNYESSFHNQVVQDFVDGYVLGETPIPCIKCNQTVKFNDMLKFAKDLGADYLATGHYVQKVFNERNQLSELHKGIDNSKDQSYFLFTTTQQQLDYLMFPLGGVRKEQTRKMAEQYDLDIADKPDSQDICFVPDGNYSKIIEKHKPTAFKSGNIVMIGTNKVLGRHNGIVNYTIGQRRGLGIASEKPLYVVKINPHDNEVVVGFKEALASSTLRIKEINWLGKNALKSGEEFTATVKLRSSHIGSEAHIKYIGDSCAQVELLQPYYGITPGQACVIYDDTRIMGGGWIVRQ